jgi:hypothetical protein
MKINLPLFIVMLTTITGCQNQTNNTDYKLTDREKHLCDSMQLDPAILPVIRQHTARPMEPFHYSLSKMYKDGVKTELDPIHLNGLLFSETNARSYQLIFDLKDHLQKKGYTIFLVENNFNIGNELDNIAVLKTTDKYAVLEQVGTDGINYDITNDSLIKLIRKFDKKYELELIGASGDWCEFYVTNENQDWNTFAKEVYKVCPDVVDQGTGTVEALADEMKKTHRLYFWWD